jgi:hypothetical protein
MNGGALPEPFLDWWFAPWEYADRKAVGLADGGDGLARRDGYRLWCERERVAPDLPVRGDPAWHIACSTDGQKLMRSASLFAGLFAARAHDRTLLHQLSLSDRKWCAGIASLQPLHSMQAAGGDTALALRGLAELAIRLEGAFPGMWSRLRLLLPVGPTRAVDAVVAAANGATGQRATATLRVQRCWQLCEERAAAV